MGGEDAPEVCVGLKGRDETVGAQREHAADDPQHAALFPYALPDQPCAADLGDRGDGEQDQGTHDRHSSLFR